MKGLCSAGEDMDVGQGLGGSRGEDLRQVVSTREDALRHAVVQQRCELAEVRRALDADDAGTLDPLDG